MQASFAQRFPAYMTPATSRALVKRSQAHRKQVLIERELAGRVTQRREPAECQIIPFGR